MEVTDRSFRRFELKLESSRRAVRSAMPRYLAPHLLDGEYRCTLGASSLVTSAHLSNQYRGRETSNSVSRIDNQEYTICVLDAERVTAEAAN
jgi:hypothetical protein